MRAYMRRIAGIAVAVAILSTPPLVRVEAQRGAASGKAPAVAAAEFASAVRDFDRTFTFRGHPIHPKLIYRFLPWMSDADPIVLSVDVVAADGSNEYYSESMKATATPNSYWADGKAIGDESPDATIQYTWLGSPAPGVHALRVTYSGGGSGVFEHLLVLRSGASRGFGLDGKLHDRLVLTFDRLVSLGDRWNGVITITPGRIRIGPTVSDPRPVEFSYK